MIPSFFLWKIVLIYTYLHPIILLIPYIQVIPVSTGDQPCIAHWRHPYKLNMRARMRPSDLFNRCAIEFLFEVLGAIKMNAIRSPKLAPKLRITLFYFEWVVLTDNRFYKRSKFEVDIASPIHLLHVMYMREPFYILGGNSMGLAVLASNEFHLVPMGMSNNFRQHSVRVGLILG